MLYERMIWLSRARAKVSTDIMLVNHIDQNEPYKYQGLPYIPRVHLSEGSLVRSHLKWLWSEEPMVRRSFIPKCLCSESCYVPKIPYSERPSTIWILCYEDSLVRSSSSPKGAMFRTSIFRKSPLPHTKYLLSVPMQMVNTWGLCYISSLVNSVGHHLFRNSGNGSSSIRRHAITQTNADLLSLVPQGANFNEIWIKIQNFHYRKWIWICRLQNVGHLPKLHYV